MASKIRSFYKRLVKNYRVSIYNKSTLIELSTFNFSRLKLSLTIFTIVLLSTSAVSALFYFSPLKKTIPGYPSDYINSLSIRNAIRLDSLQEEIEKRDEYLIKIQTIIDGDLVEDPINTSNQQITDVSVSESLNDSLLNSLVGTESLRFDYSLKNKENELSTINFYTPVKGLVVNGFDASPGHFGTDIVGQEDSKVSAVLDGTVVFAEWSVNTGYVLTLQHDFNIVSVYKHNSNLLVKQGEKVNAGQVIAIMGDEGELSTGPHLHFELWKNGVPVNPEQYISFN